MRFLINYIRSYFCKHEFELIGETEIYRCDTSIRPYKYTITYFCKKCGYFKQIK